MQNELRAPFAGKVVHLRIQTGERVEQKQTLLSLTVTSADKIG
jgi:biotin carboxyl carrier protein